MTKTIIYIMMFFLLLSSVFAVEVTDDTGEVLTSAGNNVNKWGAEFNSDNNLNIISVGKEPLDTATRCELINASNELLLANGTYTSNVCTFSPLIEIPKDTLFYVITDNYGGARSLYQSATASYQYVETNLNFTRAVFYTGSYAFATNRVYAIRNITTEVTLPDITNSSWNVTSSNVINTSSTAWNTGGVVNVSTNELTFTVNTNIDTNMSCRLTTQGNYSQNIAYSPSTKASTTETVNHTLTLFEDLSIGSNTVYCSFINTLGGGETSSGVSHSGGLIVNYNPIILVPVVNLIKPFNNSNITAQFVNLTFSTDIPSNCSALLNGSSIGVFNDTNGTVSSTFKPSSVGDYDILVNCSGEVSDTHFFTYSYNPTPITGLLPCPDNLTDLGIVVIFFIICLVCIFFGIFLNITVLGVVGSILFLFLGFLLSNCNLVLGGLVVVIAFCIFLALLVLDRNVRM